MIQVKLWLTYHFKSILGEYYFIIGRFEPYKMCFHLMADGTLSSIRFHLATSGDGGRLNLPPPPTSAHKFSRAHRWKSILWSQFTPIIRNPCTIIRYLYVYIHPVPTYWRIVLYSRVSVYCVLDTELLVL